MPHNGAKIQTNGEGLFSGASWPFLNQMKCHGLWSNEDNSRYDASFFDANGYPTTFPGGHTGVVVLIRIASQAERPGNYVIKWSGWSASTNFSTSDGTYVSGDSSGASGRRVITPTNQDFYVRITGSLASPSPPRAISLCHIDDEAALTAGEWTTPRFRELMQEIGIFRDLDWTTANNATTVNWADRRPVTYSTYLMDYYPSAAMVPGVTSSTLGQDNYSIAFSGFSLVDGARAIITFDHALIGIGADTATLNVAGTGAKIIKNANGQTAYDLVAGYPINCVYDQSLNCWLTYSPEGGSGITNGVPPEVVLAVCAECGMHPWFVIPRYVCDRGTGQLPTMTDFVTSLATYCRDNAPSWMIPHFETPNETWNSTNYNTGYAWLKQAKRSAENFDQWIGTVGSLIGQAVSAVYSNDRTKYRMIIGYHFDDPAPERLDSTYYVSQGGSAAKNWATHICTANYYSNDVHNTVRMMTLAWEYQKPGVTAPEKAALLNEYNSAQVHTTPLGQGGYPLDVFQLRMQTLHDNIAAPRGLKICYYEGGFSPDYFSYAGFLISNITKGTTTTITGFTTSDVYNLWPKPGYMPALVGMTMSFGWPGMGIDVPGMTQLNGNAYTVTAATETSITLNVNSTGFSNYTTGLSGGARGAIFYGAVNNADGLYTNGQQKVAYDAKLDPSMKDTELLCYDICTDLGSPNVGEYPSEYVFAATNSAWSIWDPDVYASPTPPRWQAVVEFNDAAEPVTDVSIRRPRIRLR